MRAVAEGGNAGQVMTAKGPPSLAGGWPAASVEHVAADRRRLALGDLAHDLEHAAHGRDQDHVVERPEHVQGQHMARSVSGIAQAEDDVAAEASAQRKAPPKAEQAGRVQRLPAGRLGADLPGLVHGLEGLPKVADRDQEPAHGPGGADFLVLGQLLSRCVDAIDPHRQHDPRAEQDREPKHEGQDEQQAGIAEDKAGIEQIGLGFGVDAGKRLHGDDLTYQLEHDRGRIDHQHYGRRLAEPGRRANAGGLAGRDGFLQRVHANCPATRSPDPGFGDGPCLLVQAWLSKHPSTMRENSGPMAGITVISTSHPVMSLSCSRFTEAARRIHTKASRPTGPSTPKIKATTPQITAPTPPPSPKDFAVAARPITPAKPAKTAPMMTRRDSHHSERRIRPWNPNRSLKPSFMHPPPSRSATSPRQHRRAK